jgi:hypothetical protein
MGRTRAFGRTNCLEKCGLHEVEVKDPANKRVDDRVNMKSGGNGRESFLPGPQTACGQKSHQGHEDKTSTQNSRLIDDASKGSGEHPSAERFQWDEQCLASSLIVACPLRVLPLKIPQSADVDC